MYTLITSVYNIIFSFVIQNVPNQIICQIVLVTFFIMLYIGPKIMRGNNKLHGPKTDDSVIFAWHFPTGTTGCMYNDMYMRPFPSRSLNIITKIIYFACQDHVQKKYSLKTAGAVLTNSF